MEAGVKKERHDVRRVFLFCHVLTKKMQNLLLPARKGMFAMETLAGVPLLFNKTRRRRAICKANRRGTNKKRTSTWMSSFYWCA